VPARKRRRRSRRRDPGRRWYLLFLVVPLALLILVIAQSRKRTDTPKRSIVPRAANPAGVPHHPSAPAAANAAKIAITYNDIITHAGGESVWLKHAAQPDAGEGGQMADGEALALAPASRAIIRAMEQQASQDGLRLQVRPAADPPKGGVAESAQEICLSDANHPVCVWQLRQVPRLYRAAIVIDDLGQDLKPAHELLAIPYPLTFSVLPNLPASRETAVAANRAGREVMLHLPMEPLAAQLSPGEGAIREGMQGPEVDRLIENDLTSVPYAAGVNNHMGSRATSDPALMKVVMKELASRRVYFIDSRTAASTVALDAARQAGVPAFYRSVFLDDTASVDYTLGQMRRFRAVIEQQGEALAIGHPHVTTIKALEESLPELERDDIEVMPASRLVGLSEVARLSPSSVHMNGSRK
jgi:polysaccharide deacetylase 2 family uncharacterized protein YibQ